MPSTASRATLPVRPDIFLSAEDHEILSRLVGDMLDRRSHEHLSIVKA